MIKPDFLESNDFTEQQILDVMNLGVTLKACVRALYYPPLLKKKCVGLALPADEPLLRLALETAVYQLGGHTLDLTGLPFDQTDTLGETAMQLNRLCDGVVVRSQRHETLLMLAKYTDVPVIGAGSNHSLPLKEIADLITMFEHLPSEKKLDECKLVYEGPASPVCTSALLTASKIGMQFVQHYGKKNEELQPPALKMAERNVKKSGGTYATTDNGAEAYHGADFVMIDAPLNTRLPADAAGMLRIDPTENLLAASRAVLACMLYENPAAREPILVEKMKRMLAVKLQALFGFGEASE